MSDSLLALALQSDADANALIEKAGEISPEQEQERERMLAALAQKVDACQAVRDAFAAKRARFEEQIKILKEYSARIASAEEAFDKYLLNCVHASNQGSLDGEFFRFVAQANPPSVVIESDEIVPPEYKSEEIVVKVDKKRIKDDLALGVPVPGCRLGRGERLVAKPQTKAKRKEIA